MADKSEKRSKAQIEQEIAAARARLSGNLQDLVGEVHPKAVVQKSIADAKAFAVKEYEFAKSQVKDPETGEWRSDRLAMFGAAAAGIATFLGATRAIGNKIRG